MKFIGLLRARRSAQRDLQEANALLYERLDAARQRMIDLARARGRRITWEIW